MMINVIIEEDNDKIDENVNGRVMKEHLSTFHAYIYHSNHIHNHRIFNQNNNNNNNNLQNKFICWC